MTVPRRVERDLAHRYTDLRGISSGGFGDVYAGRDNASADATEGAVAIKRLVGAPEGVNPRYCVSEFVALG